jgi:glucuronosyltransferase
MLGLPNPSSYIPAIIGSYFTDRMSPAERFLNLNLQYAGYITFMQDGIDQSTQMFRRNFGEDFPDLRDIVKESPIVLVNVDEVVDFPRPIFSNIVYIGGLGMDTENEKQGLPVRIFQKKLVTLF